jgi:hypothetical protein
VRLWTRVGSTWDFNDYRYSVVNCGNATMVSPANGAAIPTTQTFSWTDAGADQYWLYVGNTQGSVDIYNQDQGTATSTTVSGIPTDGRTVWVRLWTRCGSTWSSVDYSYNVGGKSTAFTQLTAASILKKQEGENPGLDSRLLTFKEAWAYLTIPSLLRPV